MLKDVFFADRIPARVLFHYYQKAGFYDKDDSWECASGIPHTWGESREAEEALTWKEIIIALMNIFVHGYIPFLCPTRGSHGCACLAIPADAERVRCPECEMDHKGGWATRPLKATNAHSAQDDAKRLELQAKLEQHPELEVRSK